MSDRFDVCALYRALNERRQMLQLTWLEVANQADVHVSTFSRMNVGGPSPNTENVARMLIWLGDTDIKPYIRDVGQEEPILPLWRVDSTARSRKAAEARWAQREDRS